MRIQHNIAAMNSYRNFSNNSTALTKNLEKLSTGYGINRAGDDAAGLAVSEKMRAQVTGLSGAEKNAKDAIGLIQTAEGGLQEVHDMLNRMYSLAEQSANGTFDETTDRANIQMEIAQIQNEIDRIGNTTNFNGKNILADTDDNILSGNMKLAIGDVGDANFGSEEEGGNILVMNFGDDDGDAENILSEAVSRESLGVDGVDASTQDGAIEAMSAIHDAINMVSSTRGKLGAYQNRIEHTIKNLGTMKENITDAESRIRDTDVAEEMMKYTKNNILNQAAQAMLAQSNQMPQGVLQLLQ